MLGIRNHRTLQYHIARGRISTRRVAARCILLERADVIRLGGRLCGQAGRVRGPRTPKTQDKPATK